MGEKAFTGRDALNERNTARLWGLLLIVWVILQVFVFRAADISSDWNGWRQADTATISERFLEAGAHLLEPRIRWGGAGTGVVESEIALYPWLMSLGQRLFGVHDVVGQVLSTLLVGLSALVLFWALRRRFPVHACLASVVALLSTRVVFMVSTAVQPESLALFLAIVAFAAWMRWSEDPSRRLWLVAFAVAGATASMVKPTAVQVPLAAAIPVLFDGRLRRHAAAFFMASGAMAIVFVLYLLHARSLYLETGNTFGIMSGGDSKLPHLGHLLRAGLWLDLVRNNLVNGCGLVGGACLVVLAAQRKLDAWTGGLMAAALLWGIASFRYSTFPSFGSHYTLMTALLGALAAAHLSVHLRAGLRPLLLGALLFQGLLAAHWRWQSRTPDAQTVQVVAAGKALAAQHPATTDLVIVRSSALRRDEYWNTENNFQDPRVFHIARVRGWVLPAREDDPGLLERWRGEGGRYFIEPNSSPADSRVGRWLQREAHRVASTRDGAVWDITHHLEGGRSSGAISPRESESPVPVKAPM